MTWSILNSVFITVLFLMFTVIQESNGVDIRLRIQPSFKLVSGLQLQKISKSSALFYKEYVPLVYVFKVPRWKKSEMVLFGSQNCNGTNYTKFFTTCPVLNYLPKLHERFSEFIANNQPLVVNLEDINAVPETTLIPFDCELIQPHFDDIYIDTTVMEEYLNRLKACSPLGSQEFISGIPNYVYNVSSIYSEMRRNFYSEYWLKIDLVDGRVDAAIWSNAVNVLNALSFQNFRMEADRWKLAVMDCEAGRIPSTVLPPSLLGDSLTDMLESLANQKMRPTVSTDTVGNFYKASLTDCTFTNDTFVVRILIPVIPSNENLDLVKVSTVSFYLEENQIEYTCQVDAQVLPTSVGNKGESYVIADLVKGVAYESDCEPGKFCHIPTELHPKKINQCVTAALNWERFTSKNDTLRMELIRNCPVSCMPLQRTGRSSLESMGNNQFLWFSGGGKEELVVNCSSYSGSTGIQSLVYKSQPIQYGTLLLDTNCDCRLSFGENVVKSTTCSDMENNKSKRNVVQVTRIAPISWYFNLNNIKRLGNVSEELFNAPDSRLLKKSIMQANFLLPYLSISQETEGSQIPIVLLSMANIALIFVVAAIGWRLHKLVSYLESIGLKMQIGNITKNITAGDGAGVSGTTMVGDQQVSYRNMDSLGDTENLLINEM